MTFRLALLSLTLGVSLISGCGALALPQAKTVQSSPLQARDAAPDVEHITAFPSRLLNNTRDLWVYLPPGYTGATAHYPVLYMQDGQNLWGDAMAAFGHGWHVDTSTQGLIESGAVPPMIIVGAANTPNRIAEYTWVAGVFPGTSRNQTAGGDGKEYAAFLTTELKPYIDSHYRTLPDRAHTGDIGSSLGGLMSYYLGLNDSRVFSKIGAMSPSVWWANEAILSTVPQLPMNLSVWLDIGGQEGDDPQTMLNDARSLDQDLLTRGYKQGQNLDYYEDAVGGHNEQAWAYRFPMALKFLYGNQR